MRGLGIFWVGMVILAALGFATIASAQDDRFRAQVVDVYDGDTMTVQIELGLGVVLFDQTLRLDCVDTPELRGDERPRGLEVRDLVREWVGDGEVVVQILGRGKYGRWLAHVTPAGWSETVNARLIDEGLADVPSYAEGCM